MLREVGRDDLVAVARPVHVPGPMDAASGAPQRLAQVDRVDAQGPRPLGETCVHFAVPAKRWAESLGYACATILFFKTPDDEEDWLARTDPADCCVTPVLLVDEVSSHPWFTQ